MTDRRRSHASTSVITASDANRRFAGGLARAFGGAIIFSFPILMTMEMWWFGFSMDRLRLVLMMLLAMPMLVVLSHYAGFEPTFDWLDDAVDVFVAYGVGFVAAAVVLLIFAVIEPGMSGDEIVGKIALQAIVGSIGAMLARSQLGAREEEPAARAAPYGGQLFLMAVGSLFLMLTVAPTEEMILIAFQMTEWHVIALALASLAVMHAFLSSRELRRRAGIATGTSQWSLFLRFTVVGYAIALLLSFYILWTFGRTDATAMEHVAKAVIVLGLPGALGAGAARLLL